MEEEEKGRNLIILATTLVLLAGSLRLYMDGAEPTAAPTEVVTAVEAARQCDLNSIQLGDLRLGCQTAATRPDTRMFTTNGSTISRGTAKFVIVGN